MKPISKKMRRLMLGAVVILAALMVWWVLIYTPLCEDLEQLEIELDRLSSEHEQLSGKLQRLSDAEQKSGQVGYEFARFSEAIVEGESLEEITAVTQLLVQDFLERHQIPITAYKEVSPLKWRRHAVGRIEIQLSTSIQGMSDILYFLENLNKVIRIEWLSIESRRVKNLDLQVSLRLGTLLLKDENE